MTCEKCGNKKRDIFVYDDFFVLCEWCGIQTQGAVPRDMVTSRLDVNEELFIPSAPPTRDDAVNRLDWGEKVDIRGNIFIVKEYSKE